MQNLVRCKISMHVQIKLQQDHLQGSFWSSEFFFFPSFSPCRSAWSLARADLDHCSSSYIPRDLIQDDNKCHDENVVDMREHGHTELAPNEYHVWKIAKLAVYLHNQEKLSCLFQRQRERERDCGRQARVVRVMQGLQFPVWISGAKEKVCRFCKEVYETSSA